MTVVYTPTDPLAAAARYTTVDTVKARLRIPAANTDFDARILSAILTGERGIDAELGHGFPELGLGVLSGDWIFSAATTAPPADFQVRSDGADTGLYLSHLDRSGIEADDVLAGGDPFDEISDVAFAHVSQPGIAPVVLTVTAATDAGTYWDLTTTLTAGLWADLTPVTSTRVILLAATAPTTVPPAVTEAATSVAHAIYKMGDAPAGTAGGDSFIGELDVAELVRAEIGRNPLLRGFKTSGGFGVA